MPTVINGEVLSDAVVQQEYQRLLQLYGEHMAPETLAQEETALRKKAYEQAVGGVLLRGEADRLEIEVALDTVDARIAEMEARCGGPAALDEVLAGRAMDRLALRESIEAASRVDALVAKITENTPEPTEVDIEAYYQNNLDQYMRPASVEAQHILIRPTSDAVADQAVARSRMEELRAKVLGGQDMGDVARTHSECPSGARSGGHLGRIAKGSMVPEFEEVLFSLAPGALSEVVETSLGLHLMRSSDPEDAAPAPLNEVSDVIRKLIRHASRGQLISDYVAELREKASIKVFEG